MMAKLVVDDHRDICMLVPLLERMFHTLQSLKHTAMVTLNLGNSQT